MARTNFGRRGSRGGQRRPSGYPGAKMSRGTSHFSKPRGSTRRREFRGTPDIDSGSFRRDRQMVDSKQSYPRDDQHCTPQYVNGRLVNFSDLHPSQRNEMCHSDHRYQDEGRVQFNQQFTMNANCGYNKEHFCNPHDRGQEGSGRGRDLHPSDQSRLSPRKNHPSGEIPFFRGACFNERSGSTQDGFHQSRIIKSPSPRGSYSANRGSTAERHHHGAERSHRPGDHSPRPRTPPPHSYSRSRMPQGPRTPQRLQCPKGPRTPQESDRVQRSTSPQRTKSHYSSEVSPWKRSPQQPRSPNRVKSSRCPRSPQAQGSSLRNRSPLRPRSPRSPQDQRNCLSSNSHNDSFQSSRPRQVSSSKILSDTRLEDGSPKRERGGQQRRESALKRLGPKMTFSERVRRNHLASRSFGKQKKSERDYASPRGPLLTLKCPHCDFSVKSFRDYGDHEHSEKHHLSVLKAAEELKEKLKSLRAKQLEEVESAKSDQPEVLESEDKSEGIFCDTCQVRHFQIRADHESTTLHKDILETLYPECMICDEKFESAEDFANHLSIFYHVKKKALREVEARNLKEKNLYPLIEIVNDDTIMENLDDTKEPSGEKANFKIEEKRRSKQGEKNENEAKTNGTKKSSVVEPNFENEDPVGRNFVEKVDMYYCNLCHKFLPRAHENLEELINTHCGTLPHREKYKKETSETQKEETKQTTLASEPDLEDQDEKGVTTTEQDSPVAEEKSHTTEDGDECDDSLEDQEEDDTLIIDNQVNIL